MRATPEGARGMQGVVSVTKDTQKGLREVLVPLRVPGTSTRVRACLRKYQGLGKALGLSLLGRSEALRRVF